MISQRNLVVGKLVMTNTPIYQLKTDASRPATPIPQRMGHRAVVVVVTEFQPSKIEALTKSTN